MADRLYGPQTVLGFGAALVLNGKGRARRIAKTWSIIPWIIPTIVVSIMWQWIFNSSYGILNDLLQKAGLISEGINFFGESRAMWTLIVINVWHWFPFTAIIIMSGLATIRRRCMRARRWTGLPDAEVPLYHDTRII